MRISQKCDRTEVTWIYKLMVFLMQQRRRCPKEDQQLGQEETYWIIWPSLPCGSFPSKSAGTLNYPRDGDSMQPLGNPLPDQSPPFFFLFLWLHGKRVEKWVGKCKGNASHEGSCHSCFPFPFPPSFQSSKISFKVRCGISGSLTWFHLMVWRK